MEIEIENYKGFEIRFNTEKETFVCDIDDPKSVKKSYSALKKFINEFVKDNQTFKPIHLIRDPNDVFTKGKEITITGKRQDGRLIYKEDGKQRQLSQYDEKRYILKLEANTQYLKELDELAEERIILLKNLSERAVQISSKLDKITLEEYRKQTGI